MERRVLQGSRLSVVVVIFMDFHVERTVRLNFSGDVFSTLFSLIKPEISLKCCVAHVFLVSDSGNLGVGMIYELSSTEPLCYSPNGTDGQCVDCFNPNLAIFSFI